MRRRACTFLFLSFFVFMAPMVQSRPSASSGKEIKVKAEADRAEGNVGDRIKLTVTADAPKGFELSFPEVPAELGDFSFLGSQPLKTGWRGSELSGFEYMLTIYSTGTHVIPPVEVKYRKQAEDEWRTAETGQIPIEIQSLLTDEEKDIRDVKGLIRSGNVLPVILTALALLFAVAAAWFFRRRKTAGEERLPPVVPAHEIAYEELRKLKDMDLPGQGRVKEYYIRLSDIVRRYLEDRFSFRAPEMTTEEFLEAVKRSPKMLDSHKKLLKNFLSECDMVKFARYGPAPIEILDSFKAAQKLIDETKIEEEEGEEG